MTARRNALVRWTAVLHRAMQIEIGRQMRSEYELPQELPAELAGTLARLDKSPTFAGAASSEARSQLYMGEDRRRRPLLRAIACEESAGKALNEGIKEIYLDLAAQWRDLARQDELLSMGAAKHT
jgi:hypothetical protein